MDGAEVKDKTYKGGWTMAVIGYELVNGGGAVEDVDACSCERGGDCPDGSGRATGRTTAVMGYESISKVVNTAW
jgi:hypothetical protein